MCEKAQLRERQGRLNGLTLKYRIQNKKSQAIRRQEIGPVSAYEMTLKFCSSSSVPASSIAESMHFSLCRFAAATERRPRSDHGGLSCASERLRGLRRSSPVRDLRVTFPGAVCVRAMGAPSEFACRLDSLRFGNLSRKQAALGPRSGASRRARSPFRIATSSWRSSLRTPRERPGARASGPAGVRSCSG